MTAATGPELTPCPLCGGSPLISDYDTSTLYTYGAGGTNITVECDYRCPACGGLFRGTVHATADWGYMNALEDGDYGEEFNFDYDGKIRPSVSRSRKPAARRKTAAKARPKAPAKRKSPAKRKTGARR
ncbi:MAG: hypothetical protein IKP53_08270 [Candidatus Methanomethylophilaceae archaeon]|nr:hypothetical protein [Candidatus Methanomethylophilaceae archaeon]